MIINSTPFSTKNFCQYKKCNDSIVSTNVDDIQVFGAIIKFNTNRNYIVLEVFNVTKISDNFYFYTISNETLKITISNNLKKCQSFNINNVNYLSILHFKLLID